MQPVFEKESTVIFSNIRKVAYYDNIFVEFNDHHSSGSSKDNFRNSKSVMLFFDSSSDGIK
ncbi:hypothetical protein ACF0H5_002901 [Mactra antiquata]